MLSFLGDGLCRVERGNKVPISDIELGGKEPGYLDLWGLLSEALGQEAEGGGELRSGCRDTPKLGICLRCEQVGLLGLGVGAPEELVKLRCAFRPVSGGGEVVCSIGEEEPYIHSGDRRRRLQSVGEGDLGGELVEFESPVELLP